MTDMGQIPTQVAIDPVKDFVSKVESDLLFHIITNMKKKQIAVPTAQQLARDFLALLPVKDKEELLIKLQKLAATYPEAREVYVQYAVPFEEEKRQEKLLAMAAHVNSGDIEKALLIAKGGQNI